MAGFIVFNKLKLKDSVEGMQMVEKWFRDNPKKKNCRTDLFNVRRGHVVEDFLKHTDPIQ